ncbi:peroxide stress protein YaaA [Pseudoruegeria sp. HB172150]|uniref:peroxide stress protein YaaA n=1 Tax=Pseudoruegeria sp. HB172150 TaxID=2721164 RepID=UPI0015539601|nr:peroxide stress protein YaaA [Pseudoruegeria sp. HB172150]
MLVVVSPAKRLDLTPMPGVKTSTPDFLPEANRLAGHARQLSQARLKALMGLSDSLARLNRDRFRDFRDFRDDPEPKATRPAVFAFAGDTYLGLEAASLEPETLNYAQRHLRILSGLYGILRPMDAIQPYRLEMGSRLKTRRGNTLYDFWRDLPAKALNAAAEEAGTNILLNCASQEYFGAVDQRALGLRIVTPGFYEVKDGEPKIVSFYAKRARGAMARFILERRLTDPAGLRDFDTGGYRFDETRSTSDQPVFLRPAEVAQEQDALASA